jgi:AcrR family transcriptional regulator
VASKKSVADVPAEAVREATRLFADRSADAVSLQEIADAIGVSKQALLYHFGNKDGLVDAVLARILDEANKRLVSMIGSLAHDEGERMEQALHELQGLLDAEPAAARVILRILLDSGSTGAQRLLEGAKPWLRFMVDLIERGQKDGTIRPDLDAEAAVAQVGTLLLTNFALLSVHGFTDATPAKWRKRRLTELVRSVRVLLFVERDDVGKAKR